MAPQHPRIARRAPWADFNREGGKATQRACRGSEGLTSCPFLFSAIPTLQISQMFALLAQTFQNAYMRGPNQNKPLIGLEGIEDAASTPSTIYPQLCCVFLCSNMVFPRLYPFYISYLPFQKGTDSAKNRIKGDRFSVKGDRFSKMIHPLKGTDSARTLD